MRRHPRATIPRALLVGIAALWAALAFRFPVHGVPFITYVVLALLTFLACALPVASPRERRVTFTAPVLFAGMLLVGPWAAGALAVVASGAFLLVRGARGADFWAGVERDILDTVATAPAALVFHLCGQRFPLRLPPGFDLPPASVDAAVAASAAAYLCVTASPAALRLRFRTRRVDTRAAVLEKTLIFVAALPFALLLVTAAHGAGLALRGLVVAVFIAAAVFAVRVGVELRALRKQVRAMELLGRQAIDAQNEDRLLTHLLSTTHDLIDYDRAVVWTLDEPGVWLHARAFHGAPAERRYGGPPHAPGTLFVRVADGLIGRVAERRRGLIVDNRVSGEAPAPPLSAYRDMASLLVVPLAAAERVIGVALFAHPEAGKYTPRELALVQGVANLAASGIENVRTHQSVREHAMTDGLTGLINHRRMKEVLREEAWRAARYDRAVSVILCDVDFFKPFNDTYGHPQGDELLKKIALVLQSSVRVVDTVARYGGEEFCIVLPETGHHHALLMAERLRTAVERTPFAGHPGGEPVYKTMSFGVAAFPEDTCEPERLIPLADAALYAAKHGGKNQVRAASAVNLPKPDDAAERRRRA